MTAPLCRSALFPHHYYDFSRFVQIFLKKFSKAIDKPEYP